MIETSSWTLLNRKKTTKGNGTTDEKTEMKSYKPTIHLSMYNLINKTNTVYNNDCFAVFCLFLKDLWVERKRTRRGQEARHRRRGERCLKTRAVNPNPVELQPLVNWYGVEKKERSRRLFWFVIQSKLYKKKRSRFSCFTSFTSFVCVFGVFEC